MVIDGKKISEEIISELKKKSSGNIPGELWVIRGPSDPTQETYVKAKRAVAERLGARFAEKLAGSEEEAINFLKEAAKNPSCVGVIVQLPLPKEWGTDKILSFVPETKDLDLLNPKTQILWREKKNHLIPPSVGALQKILERYAPDFGGKKLAVAGDGRLIGLPILEWLKMNKIPVSVFDSKNPLTAEQAKEFDIITVGIGNPGIISGTDCKRGALVVDFGFTTSGGKLLGDFNPKGAEENEVSYTKTPGGTGPILVACLFENLFQSKQLL
jgi:methylenetetrahydrofolate dehydrogenase (NADP+)/methenyltetrahydrofolate cyclohydrolase